MLPQEHMLLEGVALCSSRKALKQPSFATDSKDNADYWEQTATSEKNTKHMEVMFLLFLVADTSI